MSGDERADGVFGETRGSAYDDGDEGVGGEEGGVSRGYGGGTMVLWVGWCALELGRAGFELT